MRTLTIDEKIGIRAVFAFKGVILPVFNAKEACYWWGILCGYDISKWPEFRNRIEKGDEKARNVRTTRYFKKLGIVYHPRMRLS
jgi:hypothetical protein